MSAMLPITVVSDIVCPWCYIGRARLMRALDEAGLAGRAALTWRPYELNPGLPAEGMDRDVYLTAKFGAGGWPAMARRLDEAAAEVGIAIDWGSIRRQPNTRKAHQLIAAATVAGRITDTNLGDAAKTALFQAHFHEGRDIGANDTLIEIGDAVGLDRTLVEGAIDDPELADAVAEQEREAQAAGVDGVPFFLLFGKYGLPGAQPPEVWANVFRELAAKDLITLPA